MVKQAGGLSLSIFSYQMRRQKPRGNMRAGQAIGQCPRCIVGRVILEDKTFLLPNRREEE
ncbi:MAG TPA: hypothetical protein VGX03_20090 [Candidatus Binatia bacterium]|nr:hypothetical protein [Candidatus Binatia bacterium]